MMMNSPTQKSSGWIPWMNYILIAVNVLVFLAGTAMELAGKDAGSMVRAGALYAPLILKGQGFYRLVTSVFLHADAAHLINNMIVQFAGGDIVERNLGHLRFAVLYFVSGICGNITSVVTDWLKGEYGFSIGASGAVFGITGALLFLIVTEVHEGIRAVDSRLPEAEEQGAGVSRPGSHASEAELKSLLIRAALMTVYLLYSGWRNPVINQAAHVGGIVTGFAAAALMMPRGRRNIDMLFRGG